MSSVLRKAILIVLLMALLIGLAASLRPERNSLLGFVKLFLTLVIMNYALRIARLEPVATEKDGRLLDGLRRWIFADLLAPNDTRN